MLAREQKQSVVDTYRTHPTDTGSPEVQIALLSERIGQLTEHFKTHQKDHGSRRGLLMMVSRRRGLLDYLKKYDSERYKTVISKLGIRKQQRDRPRVGLVFNSESFCNVRSQPRPGICLSKRTP